MKYYILDKESTEFYGFDCYVYIPEPKRVGITYVAGIAKGFRTIENAEKFIKKQFTNIKNYDIIYM